MIRLIFISMMMFCLLNGSVMEEGDLYKEKQELIALKKELNEFYEQKELKYQKHKKELEAILSSVEVKKKEIEKLKQENKKQIDEINKVVTTRAITMYDKMKVKVVLDVFNKMLEDGKINEVFDIIIRLKQKRVMEILKKIDVDTKTILMEKLKNYDFEKNKDMKKEK